MPSLCALLALAVCQSLTAPAAQAQTTAAITSLDAAYPADAYGRWQAGARRLAVVRVVDARSGVPLPGAQLWRIPERDTPIRGEFWGEQIATADADGFVRYEAGRGTDWLMLRAAGYGAVTASNLFEAPIVGMSPALDLPVRVLDWRHQPVAGALVGLCGGCGHTPDLASGRTDAAGVVRLAGVDPHNHIADLYVEHPGLGLAYDNVHWVAGQAPARLVVAAADSVSGQLLDAAGQPVADAFVGAPTAHRGPWTRTRQDGSFALHGVDLPVDLHVYAGKRKVIFAGELLPTLRLPVPSGEETQIVAAPKLDLGEPLRVRLRVRDAAGQPTPMARYRLIGPLPARREVRGKVDDDPEHREHAQLEHLHAGRYEVFAASAMHKETRSEITVREDDTEFTLRVEPLPTAKVELDARGDAITLALRSEHGEFDITAPVAAGTPIGLPETPFCFVLRGSAGERVFAYEQARALAEAPLRLRWYAATRLRGKLVDAAGQPAAARLRMVHPRDAMPATELDARGTFELAVRDEGLRFVSIDGAAGTREVAVLLPELGDEQTLDLGTLVLGGPAPLTALSADGSPLRGALTLARAGWHDQRGPGPSFALDAQGQWRGPDLRAGDVVLLPGEASGDGVYALPVRIAIGDALPATLRAPAGAIRLRVTAADGTALACGVTLGDTCVACAGELTLRRVPSGRQTLWIGANEHRAARVEVDVPSAGQVEVLVKLDKP